MNVEYMTEDNWRFVSQNGIVEYKDTTAINEAISDCLYDYLDDIYERGKCEGEYRMRITQRIKFLLDKQLDDHVASQALPTFDKATASRLLKERLDRTEEVKEPSITLTLYELFLYVGRSATFIPQYSRSHFMEVFAGVVEEWGNVDRSDIDVALNRIGY